MLQVVEVSKVYREGEFSETALSNINFDMGDGDFVAIYGPSGSGKTTLLNIVGLLEEPDSGILKYNDWNPFQLKHKERLGFRRQKIGFVFSNANLVDELTVAENIELPLIYQKIKKKERRERVGILLGEMNLLHRKNNYPADLTIVQQQKIAIARALIVNPDIILADEPTASFNSSNANEILNLLSDINDKGVSVLLFTHEKRVAERARKVYQLYDGHLLLDTTIK